jgi:hypothetical protein
MKQTAALPLLASAIFISSCGGSAIEVRSIKQPLAEGRQPANSRVAEGNAQLALGNVGLAIEAYRKALREQPDSVDAMMGLATCYDRMGRSDLSRRHYEMALAVEPANTEVYSQLAQSLDAQGQSDEAARVKAELAARVVAPEASREVPGSVPVLPPPPAQSVTVALAPPRSLPVAVERPAVSGVRLQRISLREVALVTVPEQPRWEGKPIVQTATSTTIRFERKPQASVTLLNAARVQGLAARTRAYLIGRGFSGTQIGDAPAVRRHSAILYSQIDARRAERLAAQFGFALERRAGAKAGVTILLGRDAASDAALRPKA